MLFLLQGLFDAAKVDSFNLPVYFTYPNELKALIGRNEDFNIERMEILNNSTKHLTTPNSKSFTRFIRALYEGLLKVHFGSEIMDELFNIYEEKVEESALLLNPNENSMITFVLLKCKRMS
ncbi:S-adenosyl-L-methionine-dependent methyltransferase superfamily protein [Abeliophyllum distichum]|uniref:S-adenosyl-L-methionine-dependent methyltransferase superfamily protein n=1 Tax=Abeliophyllum distichum TaxID=126358 RepID=A0ABD1RAH9_9LAMI